MKLSPLHVTSSAPYTRLRPSRVALSTSVLESMASHARPLVEHREPCMRAGPEDRQWRVAAWKLVVTAAAGIGRVAHRAGLSVDGGEPTVNIVLPTRGV
jgi:hypothetical protein